MNQAQLDLLVISAQQGNLKAFNLLCEYIYPHLVRFALKQCGDKELASEAVHDSLIKMSKYLRSINDPRTFKSWIFKSVRWRVIDLIRKSASTDKQTNNDVDIDVIELTESHKNTDSNSLLLNCIDQLQAIDKESVYLFYLEEMSINEISIVLGTPEGTIKSRLSRARTKLKQLLLAHDVENEYTRNHSRCLFQSL